jgi:hypothetical protein
MILTQLNYLAIAVSAVAYFAFGAIYFNPKVMGKAWMEGHQLGNPTEEEKKAVGKLMAMTFVVCLIASIGLGALIKIICPPTLLVGAKIGLVAGVFATSAIAMSYMYTRKSFQLIAIDSAYHVIGLIIAAVIQTAWL